MTAKNTSKPLFIRLLLRLPYLLSWAKLINSKVLDKAGFRIIDANRFMIGTGMKATAWKRSLLYFERLLGLVENIEGDVVECGVWQGHTLISLAFLNANSIRKRRIWGFDSFEGLPSPSKEDISTPTSIAREGMFNNVNEATVLNNLRAVSFGQHDVENQIRLVKGWFSDTLPEYDGPIALLHLDADLYDSTKCALENLWPKVAIGGIAAFDNYQEEHVWPGEKKAVDEYFNLHQKDTEIKMCKDLVFNRFYAIRVR